MMGALKGQDREEWRRITEDIHDVIRKSECGDNMMIGWPRIGVDLEAYHIYDLDKPRRTLRDGDRFLS